MSYVIWKYSLATTSEQKIDMPEGAWILTVQAQREVPCLWVLVDPAAPHELRTIYMYGTGHRIGAAADSNTPPPAAGHARSSFGAHLGSFQLRDETLIFHVFDRTEKKDANNTEERS